MSKPIIYMAVIQGWTEIRAFNTDPEQAKKDAIRRKKKLCKDDLSKWNWETVSEYYGAYVEEISNGTVIVN